MQVWSVCVVMSVALQQAAHERKISLHAWFEETWVTVEEKKGLSEGQGVWTPRPPILRAKRPAELEQIKSKGRKVETEVGDVIT